MASVWDVVKFLLVAFLPMIIGKMFKMLAKIAHEQSSSGKNASSITVPSLWDRIRISILIVATINYFWISVGNGAPKNFFQEIQANVDAPVFQLRSLYHDFITRESEKSTGFSRAHEALKEICCAKGSLEEFDAFRERLWNRKQTTFPLFSSDPLTSGEGLRYQHYQCMFDRLKSPMRRANYLHYGEDATLYCNWCADETDFSIFVLANAAKSYCIFLVLIGLVSTKKEKKGWRKILIVITLFSAIFESLYYLAPHEVASIDIYSDIFSDGANTGLTQKLTIVRHMVFGILLLVAMLFDNGSTSSPIDTIKSITKQQQSISDMIELERLQKSVLVANKELRKHYINNFEKIENTTKLEEKASDQAFGKNVNFDIMDSIAAIQTQDAASETAAQ